VARWATAPIQQGFHLGFNRGLLRDHETVARWATAPIQQGFHLGFNRGLLSFHPLFKFRNNAQSAGQLAASISHVALIEGLIE
jgi:hypothetical protein